jgi:hypothetical protein
MKRILSFTFFIFILFAHCGFASSDDTTQIDQSAKKLFLWYSNSVNAGRNYSISIISDRKGMCRLDTVTYFRQLRKLNVFSDKYFSTLFNKLDPSIKYLRTRKFSDYKKSNAYEFSDECPNLLLCSLVPFQEMYENVEIQSAFISNGKAEVSVEFYSGGKDSTKCYWPQCAIVSFEKENGIWKITDINLHL